MLSIGFDLHYDETNRRNSMGNGEQARKSEKEPKVSFMDFLKAQREEVIAAQQEAATAAKRARELGDAFQANLRKLSGKSVTISGQLTGEEAMIQDGYEMHSSSRSVTNLKGTIRNVWANDRPEEGYNRNNARVYITETPPDKKYRSTEVMANFFDLREIHIDDEPEVPATETTAMGAVATMNTTEIS
jgi:hypothetical protein